MALGVVVALEVQDASVASASLRQLDDLIATREVELLEVRKASALECESVVPPWIEAGMGASIEQPEHVRHLIQILLGIFAAYGVLALKDMPAMSVGNLLTQHPELLEAEEKGGVGQVLRQHFAKVYKQAMPRDLSCALQQEITGNFATAPRRCTHHQAEYGLTGTRPSCWGST